MLGTSFGNLRFDSTLGECLSVRSRIVCAVSLNQVRLTLRPSGLAGDRSNAINQWQQLGNVMGVGSSQNYVQRNALRVREDVVLAARTTPTGWDRSRFFPAHTTRTEHASA